MTIKLKVIDYKTIDSKVKYFIESDKQKVHEFLKTKGFNHVIDGKGVTICKKDKNPIIWLATKRPDIVAHEMIHAIIHLFKEIGHDTIGYDNEELFAYFVDYGIREILR